MSEILFVCVHNAGRSQMAKAVFNALAVQRGLPLTAESAGTEPSDHVHPNVVEAMRRSGIDLSDARPQLITDRMVRQARRVITMGCGVDSDACPAVRYKDVEDWGIPDPAGKTVEDKLAIRDLVAARVENLVALLMQEMA